MSNPETDFEDLMPNSAAYEALSRIPKEERLPRYKENSLSVGDDCSDELKNFFSSIGLPKN